MGPLQKQRKRRTHRRDGVRPVVSSCYHSDRTSTLRLQLTDHQQPPNNRPRLSRSPLPLTYRPQPRWGIFAVSKHFHITLCSILTVFWPDHKLHQLRTLLRFSVVLYGDFSGNSYTNICIFYEYSFCRSLQRSVILCRYDWPKITYSKDRISITLSLPSPSIPAERFIP